MASIQPHFNSRPAAPGDHCAGPLQGIPGADAAFRISGLELGGLLGSLSAGAISDRLIRGNTNADVGNVGLRVKVGISQRTPACLQLCKHC